MSCVSKTDALEELLKSQPALWRGRDQHNEHAAVPTGYAQLDNVLPSGGWGIGYLTELLLEQHGIGELSLLLPGLRQVTSDNQWAAFVNPSYLPYAPALANSGINLERLLIVNTDNDNDTLWATEQLLRAGIFASVVAWVNRTTAPKQRRLQLAAELGKTWATVYRPASAQDQHSPAAMRIVVGATSQHAPQHTSQCSSQQEPIHAPQQMKLDIIKSRGGKQHSVYINPTQFDQSQGVEWPAVPPNTSTATNSIASITPIESVAPITPIASAIHKTPVTPLAPVTPTTPIASAIHKTPVTLATPITSTTQASPVTAATPKF